MMLLQRRHQAAHHRHRDVVLRFVNFHRLEPAGQGGVALKILFVFGPGSGCDGAQFATGELGLDEVRGIALPGLAAGTDERVRLVDEQDHRLR